jgi:hypothetical protein
VAQVIIGVSEPFRFIRLRLTGTYICTSTTTGVSMSEATRSDDRTAALSGPADDDAQHAGQFRSRRDGGGATAGALAVAALAVGVLACGFSWMFFIQGYIVVAGAAASVLGVLGVLAARRVGRSPLLAAAGAVLGVLSIASVFTVEAVVKAQMGGLFANLDSLTGAATPTSPFTPDTASPTDTALPTPTAAPTSEPSVPPPVDGDAAAGNSDAPLPVGQSATVGDYTVAITTVAADVAVTVDLVAAGSPEPTNGGYVWVELSATYTGADTGDVHGELFTGLVGGDGLEFYSSDCRAELLAPSATAPSLAPGESVSWQACFDVSAESLEGASLFVADLTASADTRHWQLG